MITKKRLSEVRAGVIRFVRSMGTQTPGEYRYSRTGASNLYSSCYALMTLHYLSALPKEYKDRNEWLIYLQSWQCPDTGVFTGPELSDPISDGAKHDYEHLSLHLTTTVLPCLAILGGRPRYPLYFAHKFLDREYLLSWLKSRDWTDAWLEGNNLLFVIQLLIYFRDEEKVENANERVEQFFDWLDSEVDPATGLWGTNGSCSNFVAMCGGYHQLLAYYYEKRPVKYPEKLIDTTLTLQHDDGGFSPEGGGGACEDVDAVDILTNLYKLNQHRSIEIRFALRRCLHSILEKHMVDGGFVYRLDEPFSHMGMPLTLTPENNSNMFSTWFRVHTIALISEVLKNDPVSCFKWDFNPVLSMGWHPRTSEACLEKKFFSEALLEIRGAGFKSWLKSHSDYRVVRFLRRNFN